MTDRAHIFIIIENGSFDFTKGDDKGDVFHIHGGSIPLSIKLSRVDAKELAELLAERYEFDVVNGDARDAHFNTPSHAEQG